MKRLLSFFAITALVIAVAPQAKSQDVSVDFFYNNLNGGSWIEVGNYGYCWQPDIAASDTSWRPYADGYWAYTDDGWTWISYEDWGWATYHYGRWVKLGDYGWVWKPGYEWGPAWVSWRTGGNYIGWAPLPPETEYVYESRPLTGHLDVEFDIGPAYYNFCDVRYIGEPVLRTRLVPYQQNVTYITQTVNVTNITYKNKTVYNYGPDINVVNQYSSRPIQKLKLERQANVDVSVAAKSGGLTKVQGNALVVAAPTKLNRPTKEIAPPTVKMKVAQPKIEKGWSEVGDANAQTQLKEKIKTQDLKNVPPPTLGAGPAKISGANVSVTPSQSPAPGTSVSPFEKGKGKGKNKNKAVEETQATSLGATTSPGASPALQEGGKKKNKRGVQDQLGAMPSPEASGGTGISSSMTPEAGKPGKGGKHKRDQFGGTPATSASSAAPEGMTAPQGKGKQKKLEKQQQPEVSSPGPTGPTDGGSATDVPPRGGASAGADGRGKHKTENPNGPPPPNGPSQTGGAQLEGAPVGKYVPDQEAMKQRRRGASPVEGQQGQGKQQGKKQAAEQASPSP